MSSVYHKSIRHNSDGLSDVYDVLRAFEVTDPAIAHAVKKLLAPGKRIGGKEMIQDLREAVWSLNTAIEALEDLGVSPKIHHDLYSQAAVAFQEA